LVSLPRSPWWAGELFDSGDFRLFDHPALSDFCSGNDAGANHRSDARRRNPKPLGCFLTAHEAHSPSIDGATEFDEIFPLQTISLTL
jgi:hypothetical protein